MGELPILERRAVCVAIRLFSSIAIPLFGYTLLTSTSVSESLLKSPTARRRSPPLIKRDEVSVWLLFSK